LAMLPKVDVVEVVQALVVVDVGDGWRAHGGYRGGVRGKGR
jgi:hypothetical protein